MVISHVLLVAGSGKFVPQQARVSKERYEQSESPANLRYRIVDGKCKARGFERFDSDTRAQRCC